MFLDQEDEQTLSDSAAAQLAPLTLAYIGDSVFDLYVRTKFAMRFKKNAGELHKMSIKVVNAHAQAQFAHEWSERLTEREKNVFMRGRNAKSATVPKNMSISDYRYATAIEALIGYLYLSGQKKRLGEILETLQLELD